MTSEIVVLVVSTGVLGVVWDAFRRWFADRTSTRGELVAVRESLQVVSDALNQRDTFIKERLSLHEKAIANAIVEFRDVVKFTQGQKKEVDQKLFDQSLSSRRPRP